MEIIIPQNQDTPSATIMQLRGALDGSTHEHFITEALKLYDNGTRNLIIDMNELTFLSNAGISALHQVALVFRGKNRSTLDEGWTAYHAMGNDRDSGFQEHIKLLNPSEEIQDMLNMVGLKDFFESYTEVHPAVASFQ